MTTLDAASVDQFIATAKRGDLSAVRAAVEAQPAFVLARSPADEGAIHAAHYHGHHEVCDYLFAHGQPRDVWLDVSLGDLDAVRAALDADPSLASAARPSQQTLLHSAVFWGHPAIARLLIGRGADVNRQTVVGYSVLHSAVAAPTPYCPGEEEAVVLETVELLLAHGADATLRSRIGVNALFTAAANGDLSVVQRLVAAGSDPHLAAYDGPSAYARMRPRDIAAARGHAHVVAYLDVLPGA